MTDDACRTTGLIRALGDAIKHQAQDLALLHRVRYMLRCPWESKSVEMQNRRGDFSPSANEVQKLQKDDYYDTSDNQGNLEKAVPPFAAFWYSRWQAFIFILGLFFLIRVFGGLTPPFQSPDEFNHLKRAYLLSKAVLITDNREPHSGGLVDEGLLKYMDCFEGISANYGAQVSTSEIRDCNQIHFSGKRTFSELENTAMYFPLLYAPQALALLLGEKCRLSVANSYYLARLFSSCAALSLLMWALVVYPAPPVVLALFAMPMCLFQFSSASLDAMTFATTVLAVSVFLRGYDQRFTFDSRLLGVLASCVFLLAATRIIYIVLTPLIALLYRVRRSSGDLISFVLVLCLALTWIVFSLKTVHGQGAIVQKTGSSSIISYYVIHPNEFLSVIVRTFTESGILMLWWRMFVGVLGWVDTPISPAAYIVFSIELVAIAVVSNPPGALKSLKAFHFALFCASVCSALLLFLVALSAWTGHPATFIERMQGRYLYPSAFLLAFSTWTGTLSRARATLSFAILVLMGLSSLESAIPSLLDRYYVH